MLRRVTNGIPDMFTISCSPYDRLACLQRGIKAALCQSFSAFEESLSANKDQFQCLLFRFSAMLARGFVKARHDGWLKRLDT